MTNEVQELHNMAVVITQNPGIPVVIDNTLETACTDYQTIFVTNQLIPKELRQFRRVVSRIFDGQVAHEAGHIVKTSPVKARLVIWEQSQSNSRLAKIVHNSLEDKRINHFIINRYRFDFGIRLQLLADVANRVWIDTLRMRLAQMRNATPANALKPECEFVENIIISVAGIAGMWNIDVENLFELNDSQKEFVRQTKAIFDDARFDNMVMSIVNRHTQLYRLWQDRMENPEGGGGGSGQCDHPENSFPKGQGGTMVPVTGKETKQALAQMEKALKKAEDDAKKEAEKENKRQKTTDDQQGGTGAGSGTGLNIPTPEPNEAAYQIIVQRNREHIERLLNLLKKLVKPKLLNDKWRKQGRFMTEILGKAYASSLRRNVQDVYANRSIQLEKVEACMGLLVDLSGSVPVEHAKDSLTVISEVCGRWLRDEDFAIMVFGGEYQKIKAYVEPYHTTRVRIGGMKCLGGTVMSTPLEELFKMINAQPNHRAKLVVLVSDFDLADSAATGKLIKLITDHGIGVVGLGIGSVCKSFVQQYVKNYRYIGTIRDLPEAFFDLYREVAL